MRSDSSPSFRLAVALGVMALCLMLAAPASADYVWLQRDAAGSVTGRLGEVGKPPLPADGLAAPRAFLADGKTLPLVIETDRMVVSSQPEGDLRLVASRSRAEGVLNVFQAKAGRTETEAVNDLELVPIEANGNRFKLMWKGTAVAASKVNVDTGEGWMRVLKPEADGAVTLATPFSGLYVLEVTAKVEGPVTIDGRKYEDVRHTATLSFEVPR